LVLQIRIESGSHATLVLQTSRLFTCPPPTSVINFFFLYFSCPRFQDTSPELELSKDVVPFINDNVQLSIEEYRDKLYEVGKRKTGPTTRNLSHFFFVSLFF